MPFRKSIVAVVAAVGMVAAPARAEFSQLSDAEIAARVAAVVERAVARPEAVGLSVAVARGDHVVVDAGYGKADLEWNIPADETAVFRIGSITKQFTAAAILKLAEEGKLSLDDPLAKFVPQFDTGGRTVTIRQLLNHASGVPSYTARPEYMSKLAPLELTDEEILASVDGVDFDFEPGEGWNYSNTGYYLLGMVVAKAAGKPYQAYLRDAFFAPLGLAHTFYGLERTIIPHRAQGYEYATGSNEFANDAAISMNIPGGAGALSSTAGDLVRWQMALTGGRAVSPQSYRSMITSTVPTGRGDQRYGFGLMVEGPEDAPRIFHGGGINGFNSSLTWLPELGLHTAVISNSEALPAAVIEQQIIAALTGDEPLTEARTTAQPGGEAAARKMIADLARGEPDYATMSPQLAEATRAQLPSLKQAFTAFGAVKSVTFTGVDLRGGDTYRVVMENGTLDLSLMLDAEGKIAGANLRPVGPPSAP